MMQAECKAGGWCHRSQEPQASGTEWMLGFHKRHGFLRQMCRINHFSAVRHIVGTSAAERLAAPLQTQGGSKLNLYNSSSI